MKYILILITMLLFLGCHRRKDGNNEHASGTTYDVEKALSPAIRLSDEAPWNLKQRMTHYQVPGLSLGIIDHGKVAFAKSYGTKHANETNPVDQHTIFQAASISKAFTALLLLILSEKGIVSLDVPVNELLIGWKLTSNGDFSTDVTIRMLLSHTAGTNIHGSAGYLDDEDLPGLIDLLEGNPPAKSPRVQITQRPNQDYEYSGGGYWVVQKVLEDVTGTAFEMLMRNYIFDPLAMENSTFEQMLASEASEQHAVGHQNGKVRGSGFRRYAGLASGGMYTTCHDLLLFSIELIKAYHGESELFSKNMIEQMTKRYSKANYGLGIVLSSPEDEFHFEHGGVNPGFSGLFTIVPKTRQAMVVLTNTEYPIDITEEIRHSVATAYNWPVLKPEIVSRKYRAEPLPDELTGKYIRDFEPEIAMWIEQRDSISIIHLNNLNDPLPDPLYDELIPLNNGKYLLKEYNALLEFQDYDEEIKFALFYLASKELILHTKEK